MSNKNIDPSLFALLITTIAGLILKLRIKIDRNSQTGIYQFLLEFEKQAKKDPELIDNVQKVLEESKQKNKQAKEDPELIDNIQNLLEESKQKTNEQTNK